MTTDALRRISLVAASAAISKNRLVKVNSNGEAVAIAAVGDDPVGVALEASADGTTRAIGVGLIDGAIVEIEADGSVTAGGLVTMRADGRIRDEVSGNKAVGVALNGGSAGDIIRVASSSIASA